jgi:hypothetical protein
LSVLLTTIGGSAALSGRGDFGHSLIPAKSPDGGFTTDLTKSKSKSRSGYSNAGNKELNEAMEAKSGDHAVD